MPTNERCPVTGFEAIPGESCDQCGVTHVPVSGWRGVPHVWFVCRAYLVGNAELNVWLAGYCDDVVIDSEYRIGLGCSLGEVL